MNISRRAILGTTVGLAISRSAIAQTIEAGPPLPDKSIFQSGDFVWPKKPGVFVPYNYNTQRSLENDERQWIIERDAFVAKAKKHPGYMSAEDIQQLQRLTFREFYARYAGDQRPNTPGQYSSGGGIYVGHVGILEIDSGKSAWVIEALIGKGIVRSRYEEWVLGRPGEIVWLGRVRDVPASDREKISIEAKRMLGRPYDFWNFNLADDTAFYCSKLAWLSIWRGLKFAIDGNPDSKRAFWFSPKQLLYSKAISRLHDPGPYANG